MKILVLGIREGEDQFFYDDDKKNGYGFEYTFSKEMLSMKNIELARGYEALCIVVNCVITGEVAEKLHEFGVKYILTRAAGTDHLDVEAIHRLGMQTANVPVYSPNAISEHTVMLILMMLRKMKEQLHRIESHNFSLKGLQTRELRNMTVGVVGTGRIGCTTIKNLSGFGCKILASDIFENEAAKPYVTYLSLEEVLHESDILVFHCPLTPDNHHMINSERIKDLKDGVILINTARGGLFDFAAVLEGLKCGKICGLGIDVYEGENEFLRKDLTGQELTDPVFAGLLSQENVVYTTHTAFYTDEAIRNMISTSLANLHQYLTEGNCKNEVRK